jgi:chromosome segregation ATPase
MSKLTEAIGTINETLGKIDKIATSGKEEELNNLKAEADKLDAAQKQLRDQVHKYAANIRKYNQVRESLDSFASEIDEARHALMTEPDAATAAFEHLKDVFQQRWSSFDTNDLEDADENFLEGVISDIGDTINTGVGLVAAKDFAKVQTLLITVDTAFNKVYARVDRFYERLIQDFQKSG